MPHARSSSSQRYPNRSDLFKPSIVRVPGQGYGEQAQQVAAQQAIPSGPPPIPGAGAPPAPTISGPTPSPQPVATNPLPLAVPGANGALSRPTERPNEPVTTGLPMGPGAGPEALQGIGAAARQQNVEQGTLVHLLGSLAAQPGASSAIQDLAARAQSGAM